MSTICVEKHKFHSSHQLHSPTFKDIEIPPRKLLNHNNNKKSFVTVNNFDMSMQIFADELLHHQKYLPFNNADTDSDSDSSDPYASDHFRMYEFKIRRCTRSRSHDWTDCPFAHPGEKARRRDHRRYHYSGTVCSDFRRGGCPRGDDCEFSHGVFECWLHPSRYRTEACKDGKNCKRKVCFFAHSPSQLRLLSEIVGNSTNGERKHRGSLSRSCCLNQNHCCLFCHSVTSSPTSTLLGMSHLSPPLSPSLSPPLSPVKHRSITGFSPMSRYNDHVSKFNSGLVSSKDVTEVMSSLEAMNFGEVSSPVSRGNMNANVPWIDISLNCEEQQQQFVLSPSTPSPSGSGNFLRGDCSSIGLAPDRVDVNGGLITCPDPDLGWVNELLM
ncbi:zf-CCCH domain-containing protein [Cephalotus follicularis]|uniref:Zf-CCCH domain-containing protein n=1 Tax=Cephalotus follicularis TaxID=3775 RepID=A0A1Q3C1I2_CEPFO|nr:zf-CCCH domain-containing protein [Cephalotus follicularis]